MWLPEVEQETRKYGTPVINRQNMQPRHMVSHVAPEPETAAYREHCTAASHGRCEHTQEKELKRVNALVQQITAKLEQLLHLRRSVE